VTYETPQKALHGIYFSNPHHRPSYFLIGFAGRKIKLCQVVSNNVAAGGASTKQRLPQRAPAARSAAPSPSPSREGLIAPRSTMGRRISEILRVPDCAPSPCASPKHRSGCASFFVGPEILAVVERSHNGWQLSIVVQFGCVETPRFPTRPKIFRRKLRTTSFMIEKFYKGFQKNVNESAKLLLCLRLDPL
jgi:hypothetical protein